MNYKNLNPSTFYKNKILDDIIRDAEKTKEMLKVIREDASSFDGRLRKIEESIETNNHTIKLMIVGVLSELSELHKIYDESEEKINTRLSEHDKEISSVKADVNGHTENFMYMPGGPEFESAKLDFNRRLNKLID